MRIPRSFNPRSPQSRRDLASALRTKARPPGARAAAQAPVRGRRRPGDRPAAQGAARAPLPRVRRARGPRPLGGALPPAAAGHAAAGAAHRGADEHHRPYLRPDRRAADGARLPAGRRGHRARQRLARLYGELDLLASECLRAGVWEGLGPAELAACASALVYEARQSDDAVVPKQCRPARRRRRWARWCGSGGRLDGLEEEFRINQAEGVGQREPDLELRLGRPPVGVRQGPGRGAAGGGDAGGRLRPLVQAGHRRPGPDRGGRPPRTAARSRRTRARPSTGCCAAWSRTARGLTRRLRAADARRPTRACGMAVGLLGWSADRLRPSARGPRACRGRPQNASGLRPGGRRRPGGRAWPAARQATGWPRHPLGAAHPLAAPFRCRHVGALRRPRLALRHIGARCGYVCAATAAEVEPRRPRSAARSPRPAERCGTAGSSPAGRSGPVGPRPGRGRRRPPTGC